jgi:hypothetical protein
MAARDREPDVEAPLAPATIPDPVPDLVIDAYKKDIDRTLIRENLKLTPEQRLLQLMKLQEFAEELRAAGRRAHRR